MDVNYYTRSEFPQTSYKRSIGMIKHYSLYWHEDCCSFRRSVDPPGSWLNLKVLYISTFARCSCGWHSDFCQFVYNFYKDHRQFCDVIFTSRSEKLVIANLRAVNSDKVMESLGTNKHGRSVMTFIISPDWRGVMGLRFATKYIIAPMVRIIFAPWSRKTHESTFACVKNRSNEDNEKHIAPASVSDIVKTLTGFVKKPGCTQKIEVYFIEGATYPDLKSGRDRTVLLPDTDRIREEVYSYIEEDKKEEGKGHCKVEFVWKDRGDYLREGWTDEIDPEELERWRKEEYGDMEAYVVEAALIGEEGNKKVEEDLIMYAAKGGEGEESQQEAAMIDDKEGAVVSEKEGEKTVEGDRILEDADGDDSKPEAGIADDKQGAAVSEMGGEKEVQEDVVMHNAEGGENLDPQQGKISGVNMGLVGSDVADRLVEENPRYEGGNQDKMIDGDEGHISAIGRDHSSDPDTGVAVGDQSTEQRSIEQKDHETDGEGISSDAVLLMPGSGDDPIASIQDISTEDSVCLKMD
jgi:hypothetical protein